jgi:hypothetical protein
MNAALYAKLILLIATLVLSGTATADDYWLVGCIDTNDGMICT